MNWTNMTIVQIFDSVQNHVKNLLFTFKSCSCMYLEVRQRLKKQPQKRGFRVIWQTQRNCHYRSFGSVQSHVNIWLFTVKKLFLFEWKNNSKNSLQSFDRNKWMFATDLCFSPETNENVIVHCKKLFLYVFERKNNPQNVAAESFDRHRWIFTTDLWLSHKSRGNMMVYCQKL